MFNEAYATFASICTFSLASSHRSEAAIDLHALALEVSADTRSKLLSRWTELGLRPKWHDVSSCALSAWERETGCEGLSPHYLRLQLDRILPSQIDRCIYLDVDTILLDDIESLWNQPLEGKILGACVDYLPTIAAGVSNFTELGLASGDKYFNSGVMLVHVARWRELGVSEAVLSCTQANRAHLDALGSFHQYDQYALNVVLHGKWLELDQRWNHGSELEPDTPPAIVHFNGHGKPWSPTCVPAFRDLFYKYLKQAGYSAADLPQMGHMSNAGLNAP